MLISLIIITLFIYSNNLYNGLITTKQIWFIGAMAFLIMVFCLDLLLCKKNIPLCLNIIDISLLTFYTYFFIRTVFTPYTPVLYNTRFLNYTLLIIFYFILKYANSDSVTSKHNTNQNSHDEVVKKVIIPFSEILVIVLMLTGLIQAIWGLLQLYGITRSFHSGFKITGTFFNPAPYALYLAAIFPLALGKLLEKHRAQDTECCIQPMMREAQMIAQVSLTPEGLTTLIHKLIYFISLLTVISIILVLPATMNRASWLGIAASSLYVFNYRYNLTNRAKSSLNNTARKLCALAIVILLISFMGAGLYLLKKGSSDGKLLIWEVTIGKISEKPLFGYGVGRFEAEYNNWQAGYFQKHREEMDGLKGMAAGNTKYCFNEYLEMASEIGLVGLLLFLAVIASLFLGIRKGIVTTIDVRSKYDARNANNNRMTLKVNDSRSANDTVGIMTREAQMTFLPSLISLIVLAMISFPLYSLPTLIVFYSLGAIISSHVTTNVFRAKENITFNFILLRRFLIFFVLLPFSVLLLIFTGQQYKAYYTFDEAVMIYQTGNYEEACQSFSEVYIPLQCNGSYLQYYGKAFYLNEEYPKSIEMLERAAQFTSDEILYTTLGDTYKALKRYSEAEAAYQHASYMVPHKLYPIYLLANLFFITGQKERALRTAKEVLTKKIKIESTATKEIICDMKDLTGKLKNQ